MMSTKARIIVPTLDGMLCTITVDLNGYIKHTGYILHTYYQQYYKVLKLMDDGNVKFIGQCVNKNCMHTAHPYWSITIHHPNSLPKYINNLDGLIQPNSYIYTYRLHEMCGNRW